MRIEYHRTLIADSVRNQAFYDALKRVIEPGKTTVADIGTGTGLLGLFAAKLGAKDVFLYETAEVAGVADQVLRRNRARNCHLIPCHSTEMQDPPEVDLIVSETLGNYALEENIIDTIADARERHLKKGGLIIPSRITQTVAPVVSDRIHTELTIWDRLGYDIDLTPARVMSLNNAYVRTLSPSELLDDGASAKTWDDVDLTRERRAGRKGEARWTMGETTTIYGLAYWWSAELAPGISLSTAPGAPRTHWEQLYFPMAKPMTVPKEDTFLATLRSRSSEEAGTHLSWTAVHLNSDEKSVSRQAMDLDKGWIP